MIRTLLISIGADPRSSPRPGEAVRIAAGVGAWNKVKVHLHLDGPAVACADEFAEELMNGHLFTEYLPAVLNHGGVILVDRANPMLGKIRPVVKLDFRTAAEIEQFGEKVDHCMVFS
jgi:hypothetical protein